VHLPFCKAKCTYCDFYSLAGEGQDLTGTLAALLSEAERRAPQLPRTVFLGGGTPSYYSCEELAHFLDRLDRWSRFRASAVEVTCECNPESLDLEKARALRELGVDRLSIGVQSLDPRILELFGRVHGVEDSLAAFDAARSAGFARVSIDLIYGVPGQELAAWEAELDRLLALRPDHVSAYQLTFEEGTPLAARVAEGTLDRLSEDQELAFFERTRARVAAAGLEPYEISNFAVSGQQCLHNVNYWSNGPYVGIGPSAVSKLGFTRFGNPRSLPAWRAAIESHRFPAAWEETPPAATRLAETWWLGLRTNAGIDPELARVTAGHETGGDADRALAAARAMAGEGLLEEERGRFHLTTRGWPLADAIARRFFAACSTGTGGA
jgi:oxygen-independent coproporphyrinogen-3 oxidase